MSFGDNLVALRESRNISRKELAEKLDIPYTTLRNYENNQREPGHGLLIKIATLFSVSVDELIGHTLAHKKAPAKKDEADEIAERYRSLDEHGQGAVKAILNFEHAAVVAEKKQSGTPRRPELKATKRSDGFIELRVYDQPAAAGLGNYLDDPDFHMEQYPANEIPEGTDFGIRISGDSMSPDIRNGSTAFVQSRSTIEPGKIGIFLVNGEAFCKKLMVDKGKGQIRLVSLNSDYEDRIIEECDDFSTMGLVLGHWPK